MRLPAGFLSAIALVTFGLAPLELSVAQPSSGAALKAPVSEPIDINTASIDQLMKIPGLPRTWAARIIRFRPYRGKNELLDRGIVSAEVYSHIKDHIVAHRPRT